MAMRPLLRLTIGLPIALLAFAVFAIYVLIQSLRPIQTESGGAPALERDRYRSSL